MNSLQQADPDFDNLQTNSAEFINNYESGKSCLLKRTVFAHVFDSLRSVRSKIQQIDEEKANNKGLSRQIEYTDVPNIRYQDEAINLSQQGVRTLKQIVEQNGVTQLEPGHINSLIFRQHKCELIMVTIFFVLEKACRLGFSIMLQELFLKVAHIELGQNKRDAYIYATFCGVIWMIAQISRHNAYYEAAILLARIRSELVFLIYMKLSKITQYTAKTQQSGKITNLLSNDLNAIQNKGPFLLTSLNSPLTLLGIVAILVTRFGWPGLLILGVVLIFLPLQGVIGKMNGLMIQKVNVYKDSRVKVCTEIIEGIKFIKLYGWEIAFKHIIQVLRKQEIRDYMKLAFGRSLQRSFGILTSILAAYTCFIVTDLGQVGSQLSTAKIFSTMELMSTLRISIFELAVSIGVYFQMKIIFQRFCTVFNIKEKRMIQLDPNTLEPVIPNQHKPKSNIINKETGQAPKKIESIQILLDTSPIPLNIENSFDNSIINKTKKTQKGQIIFHNFNGYWKTHQLAVPNLQGINLTIEPGQLIGVTGKVGSGKSGLLGVILEEIPYYSGTFQKIGSVAYVEQEPVIFSDTIKENILFGSTFMKHRYRRVVEMSCLNDDLEMFENGDQTIVGERGITLSGGQKARLALARALYSDADIYLLDDPISAVDSKVAKKIYEKVIMQMKGKKTVVLVTHQISYMYSCEKVIIMDEGRVAHYDVPQKLKKQLNELQMIKNGGTKNQKVQNGDANKNLHINNKKQDMKQGGERKSLQAEQNFKLGGPVSEEEQVEVTWRSYVKYIFYSSKNNCVFFVCILFFLLAEATNTLFYRFIAQYDLMKANSTNTTFAKMTDFWLALGLLLLGYLLFTIIKYFLLNVVVLNSNQQIHKSMIHGLVRSPSSYFDITPTGRLNNKFSNDLGIMDNMLAFVMTDSIEGPIVSLIMVANVFSINLYFLIPGILNIIFIVLFFTYCKKTIVVIKQLDLKLKTPVFNMVGEMIAGLVQIRIFGRRPQLLKEFATKINNSFRGNISFWNFSRVFGANLNYVSILMMTIGWIIGIAIVNEQTAGLYGVSVVFLIQTSDYLQWFIRQFVSLQSMIVSVERTFIVANLQPEKELRNKYDQEHQISYEDLIKQKDDKNTKIDKKWPRQATIKFDNFSMRYRAGLPLVIKNVSFEIKDCEKVGIVGRTGAGKSSIIQAIFRICEPEAGSVYEIGGCDALQMGLHSLRQNISVIPQTPFLFKGSIKKNLDPFEAKTEQQLWQVLEESDLMDTVQKLPQKMQTDVTNISEVFSVGQKQLLCLARALLRKNRILVLDEATSNVDMKTDHFIQNCIKTKFSRTTVITVAHRLNTIADYDKVIVMDQGRIAEIGSPYELLQKKGMFAEMVEHTGPGAETIRKIAQDTQQRKKNS